MTAPPHLSLAGHPVSRRRLRRLSRQFAAVGVTVPPARLAVRAQALIGFDAERETGRAGGWLGRLFPSGPLFALQRAAMIAMVIVVAGAGFVMGGGLGDSFAQQRYGSDAQSTARSTATTSSELSDLFVVSDGI